MRNPKATRAIERRLKTVVRLSRDLSEAAIALHAEAASFGRHFAITPGIREAANSRLAPLTHLTNAVQQTVYSMETAIYCAIADEDKARKLNKHKK